MAMTRIEDGIQDTEPIRFLELLGLDEEDLAGYSIRLNGSNPEWGKWSDLPDAYYFSYDDLMKWIFTKKWPDKDKATAQIHTRKVLQFIQLKPENPPPHTMAVRRSLRRPRRVHGERRQDSIPLQ